MQAALFAVVHFALCAPPLPDGQSGVRSTGPGILIEPLRLARVRMDAAGHAVRIGDWMEYVPNHTRAVVGLAFDCFEPDGGQPGYPTDGLYGVDCGVGPDRWFFGQSYCNPYVLNDLTIVPDAEGDESKRIEFAWYWGPPSAEQCFVMVFTAETFDDTCVGPAASGYYDGVIYDFGVQAEPPNSEYFFADIDLTGYPYFHQLPTDGSGAYDIHFLREYTPEGSFVLASCAQPMLWGTKALNPSYQGPIQWDDDSPTDGVHTAPNECYDYTLQVCPDPLGAMACFYYTITDCNSNGIEDWLDIVNSTSADADANGVPDECELVVEFAQLDWQKSPIVFNLERSDWGQITIDFESADAARMFPHPEGGLYVWINVVTRSNGAGPDNWAVKNLPLYAPDAAWLDDLLPTAVWYNLAVTPGTVVGTTDYSVTFSATPVLTMPTTGRVFGAPVGRDQILLGGREYFDPVEGHITGGTSNGMPPIAQNYVGAIQVQDKQDKGGSITIKEKDVPKVNEEQMGCAPSSVGRSLRYLDIKDDNFNLGLDAQGIYEILKDGLHMQTDLGEDGVGTFDDKMLQGKKKFLREKRLKIDIYTGTSTEFHKVIKFLNEGLDVEILVYWGKGRDGKSLGGHAAFVSRIVIKRNAQGAITGYTVTVVDDKKQGDGKAASDAHTLEFDANGNLMGFGTGAKLSKFIVERAEPVAPSGPPNKTDLTSPPFRGVK